MFFFCFKVQRKEGEGREEGEKRREKRGERGEGGEEGERKRETRSRLDPWTQAVMPNSCRPWPALPVVFSVCRRQLPFRRLKTASSP